MRVNRAKRAHLLRCVDILDAEPAARCTNCTLAGPGWSGEFYGGAPVQGEGKMDGLPFYFRARWDEWVLRVDNRLEVFGDHPNASWLSRMEAQKTMSAAVITARRALRGERVRGAHLYPISVAET